MLNEDKKISSKNGFPSSFNFKTGQQNSLLITPNGGTWYPYINRGLLNCGRLEDSIINEFNAESINGFKILYHATSWIHALRIAVKVKTTTRGVCTDFGMNNFYTTNSFYAACDWALRNNQAAIVIFAIPNEQFYEWNIKNLTNTTEWRNVVFRLRNEPDPQTTPDYENALNEYENLVEEMDSYDLVQGPIMSNTGVKNPQDVQFMRNNDGVIPHQFSFKKSIVGSLNLYLLTTLFFSESL